MGIDPIAFLSVRACLKGIILVSLVVGSVLYRIVPYFGNERLLPVPRMPRMFTEGRLGKYNQVTRRG